MVTVEFKNISNKAELKMLNFNGQLIKTYQLSANSGVQKIETTHLAKGMYLLILQEKGIVLHKKLIIQ
jgi:hypothetical protein